MPWYALPLVGPCLVVIVIVLVVAVRPGISKNLAEVMREIPPILIALVPRISIPGRLVKSSPELHANSSEPADVTSISVRSQPKGQSDC
jgi:hypothetical protein